MSISYSDLLELFLKFGSKLPIVWEEIQKIISSIQAIRGILAGNQSQPMLTSTMLEVQSYDIELESQVMALFNGVPAEQFGAPDFPRLRQVFEFVKQHPELLKILLSLLG